MPSFYSRQVSNRVITMSRDGENSQDFLTFFVGATRWPDSLEAVVDSGHRGLITSENDHREVYKQLL